MSHSARAATPRHVQMQPAHDELAPAAVLGAFLTHPSSTAAHGSSSYWACPERFELGEGELQDIVATALTMLSHGRGVVTLQRTASKQDVSVGCFVPSPGAPALTVVLASGASGSLAQVRNAGETLLHLSRTALHSNQADCRPEHGRVAESCVWTLLQGHALELRSEWVAGGRMHAAPWTPLTPLAQSWQGVLRELCALWHEASSVGSSAHGVVGASASLSPGVFLAAEAGGTCLTARAAGVEWAEPPAQLLAAVDDQVRGEAGLVYQGCVLASCGGVVANSLVSPHLLAAARLALATADHAARYPSLVPTMQASLKVHRISATSSEGCHHLTQVLYVPCASQALAEPSSWQALWEERTAPASGQPPHTGAVLWVVSSKDSMAAASAMSCTFPSSISL